MKIGIFDPYLDALSGGERYMLTLALCLSQHHEVFLFWNPSNKAQMIREVKKKFNFDISRINFVSNIFDKEMGTVSRLKKSLAYDRIIFLSDGSFPLMPKKNLIIHFQFPVEWVNADIFKTRIKFLNVRNVICNSHFTKSYIDKKFNINSTILYPPVDMISIGNIKKENIILTVGRYGNDSRGSSFKKQDILIDVFKQIVGKRINDWIFKIVASTRKEDELKLKELRKKAEGFPIEIIENPDNEVLKNEFAKAKIYWHASGFGEDLKHFPERAEHFGISVVEAMSTGTIPVVFNAGGLKESVDDGKNGLLWSTIEECVEKTIFIIKDESQRKAFSLCAQEKAHMFKKERFCNEISDIIK